ncbi:MAG: hypothetical protein EBR42_11945, partial [Betaproteobacteria bacterium]|nr:hypothetical protein [Betaproteobacteria bacterium]
MKFLVIGLGSMGKRRIRCLQALGFQDIVGVDVREDRRHEAQNSYGIQVHSDYAMCMNQDVFHGVVISLPPLLHVAAMQACLKHNTPFFVEASVVDDGLADIILGAPYSPVDGGASTGRSYVVYGKASTTNVSLTDVTNNIGGFAIIGQGAQDLSGFSVGAAGDVNGDGLADLIVGAPGYDTNASSTSTGRSTLPSVWCSRPPWV